MKIIAHRGASAFCRENTLAAFQRAMEMGADFIETDVQRSKDGVLVLYHDYVLPDGRALKDMTFAELKKYEIPRVLDLLKIAPARVKLNLEIKNDDNLYPSAELDLLRLLNESKWAHKNRILLSSFDLSCLKRARLLDEKIKIGRLARKFNLKEILALNCVSLHMSVKRIDKKIIDACHRRGLKVFVYTVNDIKTAQTLRKMKVDAVFSDNPKLF